jgi:hypothetical protein
MGALKLALGFWRGKLAFSYSKKPAIPRSSALIYSRCSSFFIDSSHEEKAYFLIQQLQVDG